MGQTASRRGSDATVFPIEKTVQVTAKSRFSAPSIFSGKQARYSTPNIIFVKGRSVKDSPSELENGTVVTENQSYLSRDTTLALSPETERTPESSLTSPEMLQTSPDEPILASNIKLEVTKPEPSGIASEIPFPYPPDSLYSIEDFTAIMAFGVQLNVDHPSVRKKSTSSDDPRSTTESENTTTARSSQYTAEDIIGEVKGKLPRGDTGHSMYDILSFFGAGTPNSLESLSSLRAKSDIGGNRSESTDAQKSNTSEAESKSSIKSSSSTEVDITSAISITAGANRESVHKLTDEERLQIELPIFEREIKLKMLPVTFEAGEYIIRKHDIGHEMYFLSKGTVEVVSGNGKTVYSVVHKGSFFGELGVLFNVPRTASVRAAEDCYCMVLTRESLEYVLKYFPVTADRFRKVAGLRMAQVKKMIMYKKSVEYQQKMDAVKEEE